MTANDLQSLIDDMARSIAAFNDSEQTWQDCPQGETVHKRGRYCKHQVVELAGHLVANKHPVQVEAVSIAAARLTDEEIVASVRDGTGDLLGEVDKIDRAIADAATAKALDFQDARRKALVEALREISRNMEAILPPHAPERIPSHVAHEVFAKVKEVAQAALKQEEEANGY